mmetsp:Transcript_28371/g.55157  ORF Transcript_28371/g.55157 Transcript_28371/m.55157 type:complete len:85 (+) Transcript_28371:29-283(+)
MHKCCFACAPAGDGVLLHVYTNYDSFTASRQVRTSHATPFGGTNTWAILSDGPGDMSPMISDTNAESASRWFTNDSTNALSTRT